MMLEFRDKMLRDYPKLTDSQFYTLYGLCECDAWRTETAIKFLAEGMSFDDVKKLAEDRDQLFSRAAVKELEKIIENVNNKGTRIEHIEIYRDVVDGCSNVTVVRFTLIDRILKEDRY